MNLQEQAAPEQQLCSLSSIGGEMRVYQTSALGWNIKCSHVLNTAHMHHPKTFLQGSRTTLGRQGIQVPCTPIPMWKGAYLNFFL